METHDKPKVHSTNDEVEGRGGPDTAIADQNLSPEQIAH